MNTINIKVKLGKTISKITSKEGNLWEVHLKSLPVNGKANLELVKLVSKETGKRIEIVKGFKSNKKVLRIF